MGLGVGGHPGSTVICGAYFLYAGGDTKLLFMILSGVYVGLSNLIGFVYVILCQLQNCTLKSLLFCMLICSFFFLFSTYPSPVTYVFVVHVCGGSAHACMQFCMCVSLGVCVCICRPL